MNVKKYLGAFPDDVPLSLPHEARFVMNYQGSDEGGSHWYGVVRKGTVAKVIDSLGFPPDDSVVKLLTDNGVTDIYYSTDRAQRDDDNVCGALAVASLLTF